MFGQKKKNPVNSPFTLIESDGATSMQYFKLKLENKNSKHGNNGVRQGGMGQGFQSVLKKKKIII